MKEQITPHLRELIARTGPAIELQYKRRDHLLMEDGFHELDPLGEESKYEVLKGLIHKFSNRVLWKVSYRCAAHCRFCTRHRQIGSSSGDLAESDVEAGLAYIKARPEIDDVILSGGDPLYTPAVTERIVSGVSTIDNVRALRIGTRLPLQSPQSFRSKPILSLLDMLTSLTNPHRTVYILLHVNHPDELTEHVVEIIAQLRRTGLVLLSQTVFLAGINDQTEVLAQLFRRLYFLGVIPYYIYRCDRVKGLEQFACSAVKERHIVTELTRILSGIAVPTYVIDVEGRGKIPVPLNFWEGRERSTCLDCDGNLVQTGL